MSALTGTLASPILSREARSSVPGVQRAATAAELEALAPAWDELLDASSRPYVLLDHRWVSAWWRAFGANKELHVLRVERGGRTIGLVPTILSEGREVWPMRDGRFQIADDARNLRLPEWRRAVPVRRVSFPLNVASHNARAHALAADEHTDAVCRAATDYWADRARDWDVMALEGLPCGSGQREAFKAAARHHRLPSPAHGARREIFMADLSGGFEGFLSRRSGHFRRRRKEQVKACGRHGALDLATYRGGDIGRGLETMFAIERRTWKSRPDDDAAVDMSLDEGLRGFFSDVGHAFAATDEAAVYVMSLDGEPVGALMALGRGSTMLSLVIYLADSVRRKLNTAPLWTAFFEDAAARACTSIDIHGVTDNVRKWSTHADAFQRLYVFSPHARGLALYGAKSAATALSRLRRTAFSKGET